MRRIIPRISTGIAAVLMATHSAFCIYHGRRWLAWEGPLVFGGELTEFMRKACLLVLAIAFLVGGAGLVTMLFGVSGALI